jgi:hypothetical protein
MKDQSTSRDSNDANARCSASVLPSVPRQSSWIVPHQEPSSSYLRDPLLPSHSFPKSGGHAQGSGILISSPSGSTANLLTPLGHSTNIDTDPITDSTLVSGRDSYPVGLHFREGSGNARKAKASMSADVFQAHEEHLHLLSPHLQHTYPPSQSATSPQQAANFRYRNSRDHPPISAPTVFSRHAVPLSLPQLDEYISLLTPPAFSSPSGTKADINKDMFIPLDRLAATGRSIESLEANYKVKPSWRNCSTILGGVVNVVLGVTVSSFHSAARALLDMS